MLYAKLFKAEHEPLQVRHETHLKNESEHAFPLKVPIIIPQKYVQGQLCCNIAWVQTSTSILVNVVLPTSQTFASKANPCRSVPYIYAIILTGATIYKMKKKVSVKFLHSCWHKFKIYYGSFSEFPYS